MDLLRFAEFAAVLALGDRATFLLDFEQRAFGVVARRGAVPLDARLTVDQSK